MQHIPYNTPEKLKEFSNNRRQDFTLLFKRLKAKKPKNLDDVFHELHDEDIRSVRLPHLRQLLLYDKPCHY